MRVVVLLVALALAGCFGGGYSLYVSNGLAIPASVVVHVIDSASRDVAFSHDFGTIEPGASDTEELPIDRDGYYLVNVTTVDANGTARNASKQVRSMPTGASLQIFLAIDGKLEIMTLVAE